MNDMKTILPIKEPGVHRIFSFLRTKKGQSLVEFALILPFLLILIGGVIDFGLSLFVGHVIENAAREGARAGALIRPAAPGGPFPAGEDEATCTVGTDCDGNPSIVLAAAYEALPANVGLLSDFTIESQFVNLGPPAQGKIEVTISGAYQWFILQMIFSSNSLNLSRTASMRWEWQIS